MEELRHIFLKSLKIGIKSLAKRSKSEYNIKSRLERADSEP